MKLRVLIVDVSIFNVSIIENVIVSEGHEVVGVAVDGVEGLDKLKELLPDLITLDLNMPNNSGVGFLKTMKEEKDDTDVIIITAEDDPILLKEIRLWSKRDLLSSPFLAEELIKMLRKRVLELNMQKAL